MFLNGIFNNHFIANILLNVLVKEIFKIISILCSCSQKLLAYFYVPLCMCMIFMHYRCLCSIPVAVRPRYSACSRKYFRSTWARTVWSENSSGRCKGIPNLKVRRISLEWLLCTALVYSFVILWALLHRAKWLHHLSVSYWTVLTKHFSCLVITENLHCVSVK